jgi:hypothetical protein
MAERDIVKKNLQQALSYLEREERRITYPEIKEPKMSISDRIKASKNMMKNLFNKLDTMYVLMPVQENLSRLHKEKGKFYHLVINTDPTVRHFIWSQIKSAMTYAYQTAYNKGIQRGIALGYEMREKELKTEA